MFEKILKTIKKKVDETEYIDNIYYAKVMDELEQGFRDKALVGKALAKAQGDEGRFNSIYIRLRAEALQERSNRIIKNTPTPLELARKDKKGYFQKYFERDLEKMGYRHPFYESTNTWIKDGNSYEAEFDTGDMSYKLYDEDENLVLSLKYNPAY